MTPATDRPRRVTPFANQDARFLAGTFGVRLFLLSLAMLFAGSLIGFLVIRLRLGDAWPSELPSLPPLLWFSTVVLVASSGTMQWAVVGARANRIGVLTAAMSLTVALALLFLAIQVVCGMTWLGVVTPRWSESEEYRFALACFYVLTALHALHVVGGLVPMSIVTVRAWRRQYASANPAGVKYCAMYWHFLDAVWLVLFASLLVGL